MKFSVDTRAASTAEQRHFFDFVECHCLESDRKPGRRRRTERFSKRERVGERIRVLRMSVREKEGERGRGK